MGVRRGQQVDAYAWGPGPQVDDTVVSRATFLPVPRGREEGVPSGAERSFGCLSVL